MKILQVNKLYYPWIGGIERAVQQISEGIALKEDIDVTVLCGRPSKGKRVTEVIHTVNVIRAKTWGVIMKTPVSFDILWQFRKLARTSDCIVIHHPSPLFMLAYLLFGSNKPLIVHYHSDIIKQRFAGAVLRPCILRMLRKTARIVVSNSNMIESSSILRQFRTSCEVIPFGVDQEEILSLIDEDEVDELQRRYGRFVLFVGRLTYYKGVSYLLDAMNALPDIPLVIIGEGDLEDALTEQIVRLKLTDRVTVLPPQSRKSLYAFYQASCMTVLPSVARSEAFGISLLEAMACGTPVISTELGTGTSYVNRHGESGFVVPPKDSTSLAKGIEKLFKDEELRKTLSSGAKACVRNHFLLKDMIDLHEHLYRQYGN